MFKGSALTGWSPLGQADWRAQNGEIVGTPKQPDGGWLVLNKSYQDVAVYTNVTCAAGCKAGVLLRAEKTPDGGMKGVYVSLTEGDLVFLRCDARRAGCREVARAAVDRPRGWRRRGQLLAAAARRAVERAAEPRPLPGAGAAPPAAGATTPAAAAGGAQGAGRAGPPPMPAGVDLPGLMTRPAGAYKSGQTNTVDITLANTSVTVRWNGGSLGAAGGNADFALGKYGPIALYVGGTGSATFKDLAYADSDPASVRRGEDARRTSARSG